MPEKKLLELFTIEFSLTYQALVLEAVVDRSDKEPEGPVMQGVRTSFVKNLNEFFLMTLVPPTHQRYSNRNSSK